MKNFIRKIRIKLIISALRKHHSEGLDFDPERRIYIFRWTEELDRELFGR